MTAIHYFDDTGEAYDASQCREEIHGGDVLVARDKRVVGFLCKAWPVAVGAEHGHFHTIADGMTIDEFVWKYSEQDGVDYVTSLRLARAEIDKLADLSGPDSPVRDRPYMSPLDSVGEP